MIDTMSIGAAVALLERCRKVARQGWNGKGMYLFLADGQPSQKRHACYSAAVGGKRWNGQPIPAWSEIGETQKHWRAAERAVAV